MQNQFLKTILDLTFDMKFIIFIIIHLLPIQELNSEEWEEKKQNTQLIENLNITNPINWQKIETNEEKYKQRVIWDKIETTNQYKGEENSYYKDNKQLLEYNKNSKDNTSENKFR